MLRVLLPRPRPLGGRAAARAAERLRGRRAWASTSRCRPSRPRRAARVAPVRGRSTSAPTSWPPRSATPGVGARAYYRVPVHRQPAMAAYARRSSCPAPTSSRAPISRCPIEPRCSPRRRWITRCVVRASGVGAPLHRRIRVRGRACDASTHACPRGCRSAAFPVHRHSLLQLAVDAGLVALAYWLAFRLRFDPRRSRRATTDLLEQTIVWVVVSAAWSIFALFGLYQKWWRYAGPRDLEPILKAVVVATLALVGRRRAWSSRSTHLVDAAGVLAVSIADRRHRALLPADRSRSWAACGFAGRAVVYERPLAGLPRPPRRARGADRRRRRRRPAACCARSCATPSSAYAPDRLRRRRPAQARHARPTA